MIPLVLYSKVGCLHCAVAVVRGIRFRIAVVKAAAVAVMVAVYHPVLAFRLVVHGGAGGVVPTHSHSRNDERSVHLVPVQCHGRKVCQRNVVHSSHGGAYHVPAGSLDQVVLLGRLVVDYRDEAIRIRAEGVLGGGVGIAALLAPARRNHAYVQGGAVGLADNLVERAVVVLIEGAGGTVRGGARRTAGGVDVAGAFRPLRHGGGASLRAGDDGHEDGRSQYDCSHQRDQ